MNRNIFLLLALIGFLALWLYVFPQPAQADILPNSCKSCTLVNGRWEKQCEDDVLGPVIVSCCVDASGNEITCPTVKTCTYDPGICGPASHYDYQACGPGAECVNQDPEGCGRVCVSSTCNGLKAGEVCSSTEKKCPDGRVCATGYSYCSYDGQSNASCSNYIFAQDNCGTMCNTPPPPPPPVTCGDKYCDIPNTCNGGQNYYVAQACSDGTYNKTCDPTQCKVNAPAPAPSPVYYSCSAANSCTRDLKCTSATGGCFTSPTCNNTCAGPAPAPSPVYYSCSAANSCTRDLKCTSATGGCFTSPTCNNTCVGLTSCLCGKYGQKCCSTTDKSNLAYYSSSGGDDTVCQSDGSLCLQGSCSDTSSTGAFGSGICQAPSPARNPSDPTCDDNRESNTDTGCPNGCRVIDTRCWPKDMCPVDSLVTKPVCLNNGSWVVDLSWRTTCEANGSQNRPERYEIWWFYNNQWSCKYGCGGNPIIDQNRFRDTDLLGTPVTQYRVLAYHAVSGTRQLTGDVLTAPACSANKPWFQASGDVFTNTRITVPLLNQTTNQITPADPRVFWPNGIQIRGGAAQSQSFYVPSSQAWAYCIDGRMSVASECIYDEMGTCEGFATRNAYIKFDDTILTPQINRNTEGTFAVKVSRPLFSGTHTVTINSDGGERSGVFSPISVTWGICK